jgi:hypothetical protein
MEPSMNAEQKRIFYILSLLGYMRIVGHVLPDVTVSVAVSPVNFTNAKMLLAAHNLRVTPTDQLDTSLLSLAHSIPKNRAVYKCIQ